MEYMILIYGDESAFGGLKEAQLKAMYAEYGTYTQELMKAGVMRSGSELKPGIHGNHGAPSQAARFSLRMALLPKQRSSSAAII
jgi:hypothetical protein